MSNLVEKQETNKFALEVEQKKNELTTILQKTILEQYAFDLNSQTQETFKKKQEVAMFISKLVATKDKVGRPAILSCTPESIRDCCITYCNNELNFFRNQAYLFPFGNQLSFMIGKDGYVSMAKQLNPDIEDFYYEVVYKKDEFEFSKMAGKTIITKHNQKLENITCEIKDIVCAYATCVYKNGTHEADIMTVTEILNALKTAQKSGFSDTHKLNPRLMLSKFPLRRLAKRKINQSSNEEFRKNIVFEDEESVQKQQNQIENQIIEIVTDSEEYEEINNNDFIVESNESLENSEPINEINEEIEEEWTPEEIVEANEMANQFIQENEKRVPYKEWKDVYMPTNKWYSVKESYDSATKMITIRKKND